MQKGITPIISIIILLLITIALAGAAYTYLSTYFTGTTAKAIQIADSFCSGTTATIRLQNVGTQPITIAATCTVTGTGADCGDIDVTLQAGTDLTGATLTPAGALAPLAVATFTDSCPTADGLCQYRFLSEGTALGALVAQVSC